MIRKNQSFVIAAQIRIRATMSRMRRGSILRKNSANVIPLKKRMSRIIARPAMNPSVLVIIWCW